MHSILLALYIATMGFANICRGEKFFNHIASTTVGRLLATLIMSLASAAVAGDLVLIPTMWIGLMLWAIPGWDNYWSAAIGNPTDITKKSFAPVDFIMRGFAWLPLRIWGTVAMGLRGGICLSPLMVALAFCGYPMALLVAPLTLLQGVPYLIGGIPTSKAYSIPFAEVLWGMCLGGIFSIILA